jgi:DNA-binding CsgD family transcriptional regulator
VADLGERDERAIFALACDWTGALPPAPEDARRLVVEALLGVIPSDASLVSFTERNRLGTISSEPAIADWRLARADDWLRLPHPVVAHWLRSDDGRAVRLSDVITTPALHRLDLYQWFWRPFGVEHTLGVRIRPVRGGPAVDLASYRGGRDFSARDVLVLDRFADVAARLLARAAARPAIDVMTRAYALSPREAEVLAWAAIGETNGRIARLLGLSEPTVKKHLQHVFRRLGVHARVDAGRIVRGAWPLAPDGPPPAGAGPFDRLTPRQRDVLASAALGRSRRAIAADLGIAPGTVKRHLEDAYRRLGVDSRSAGVAALALRLD